VASILGSGILALPVKVSECGFLPFLSTFVFSIIAQIYTIVFMVDLLQYTQILQNRDKEMGAVEMVDMEFGLEDAHQLLEDEDDESDELMEMESEQSVGGNELKLMDQSESGGEEDDENVVVGLQEVDISDLSASKPMINDAEEAMMASNDAADLKFLSRGPDMYTMAAMFLPVTVRWIYVFAIFAQYTGILTSYALAGPQSIAKFINLTFPSLQFPIYYFLILPFVALWVAVLIFGSKFIEIVISGFTLFKGLLLMLMILLTGIIALSVRNADYAGSQWAYVGRPFLVGTVALGGAANVLPVVFAKLKMNKLSIRLFKGASISGVIFCAFLNIMWAFEVLQIVPLSRLRLALQAQEISTVPLIDILEKDFRQYEWLSYLVDIFVLVSVCVSFVCLGSGLKHFLDGMVRNYLRTKNFKNAKEIPDDQTASLISKLWKRTKNLIEQCGMQRFLKSSDNFLIRTLRRIWYKHATVLSQWALYFFSFFNVYLIAQVNPKAFFTVMEVVVSASLNAECGLFICWMAWNATRRKKDVQSKLLVSMSLFSRIMIIPVFIYFLLAVLYDFAYTGIEIYIAIVNTSRSIENKVEIPF